MTEEPTQTTEICEDDAHWKRGLFTLFFLFCFALAEAALWMAALVQFFWMLFRGAPNDRLRRFGVGLAGWLATTVRYLSADTTEKPFPFTEWPAVDRSRTP